MLPLKTLDLGRFSFDVVGVLDDADNAESEVVLARDRKSGETVVIKAELKGTGRQQVNHDRNTLAWLWQGRGLRECAIDPDPPPRVGLPYLHAAFRNGVVIHARQVII